MKGGELLGMFTKFPGVAFKRRPVVLKEPRKRESASSKSMQLGRQGASPTITYSQ